jgi:hypothetical protein
MFRARAVDGSYNGVPVFAPPLPVIAALAVLGAAAMLLYLAREARALRAGAPVHLLGPSLIVGVNGLWAAALLLIDDPLTPFYAIASAHYVQYLWFVGRRARLSSRRPLRWTLAMAGGAGAVVAALTVIVVLARRAAGSDGVVPPWAAAVVAVNLEHYWLDARIWRRGA